MASFNRVILVGNLTREIELRYTSGGTAVTDVGLAVNDRRKSASGEWVEETTFIDVTLWGRTAEVAGQYLGKGSSVLIEGRLKLDTWEKDGQKRSKLHVVGERMQMLGGRSGGGGGGERSVNQAGEPATYGQPAEASLTEPSVSEASVSEASVSEASVSEASVSEASSPPQAPQATGGPPEDEIPF